MTNYLIEMFGVSLFLTIVVELTVVFWVSRVRFPLFGQRQGKGIALVVLVNVLTNPPAVLLCFLGRLYMPHISELWVQLAVEIMVVAVEACIYHSFAKEPQWQINRPILLAVIANMCSWLLGVVSSVLMGL